MGSNNSRGGVKAGNSGNVATNSSKTISKECIKELNSQGFVLKDDNAKWQGTVATCTIQLSNGEFKTLGVWNYEDADIVNGVNLVDLVTNNINGIITKYMKELEDANISVPSDFGYASKNEWYYHIARNYLGFTSDSRMVLSIDNKYVLNIDENAEIDEIAELSRALNSDTSDVLSQVVENVLDGSEAPLNGVKVNAGNSMIEGDILKGIKNSDGSVSVIKKDGSSIKLTSNDTTDVRVDTDGNVIVTNISTGASITYKATKYIDSSIKEMVSDTLSTGGSVTTGNIAMIPEYSLSEYYESLDDMPTPQEYVNSLSGKYIGNLTSLSSVSSSFVGAKALPFVLQKYKPFKWVIARVGKDAEFDGTWVYNADNFATGWRAGTPVGATYESRVSAFNNDVNSINAEVLDVTNYFVNIANEENTDGKWDILLSGKDRTKLSWLVDNLSFSKFIPTTSPNNEATRRNAFVEQQSGKLISLSAQSVGYMRNKTPYSNFAQRVYGPLVQLTTEEANKHVTVTKASSDALNMYLREEDVPVWRWDFDYEKGNTAENTNIVKNCINDEDDTKVKMDYYTWVSKTTEADGIYIADWVDGNELPDVFKGVIDKTDTLNGTSASVIMSKPVERSTTTGDVRASVSKVGNTQIDVPVWYADWAMNNGLKCIPCIYCEEYDIFVPAENIEDHEKVYIDEWLHYTTYVPVTKYKTEYQEVTRTAPSWQSDLTIAKKGSKEENTNTSEEIVGNNTITYEVQIIDISDIDFAAVYETRDYESLPPSDYVHDMAHEEGTVNATVGSTTAINASDVYNTGGRPAEGFEAAMAANNGGIGVNGTFYTAESCVYVPYNIYHKGAEAVTAYIAELVESGVYDIGVLGPEVMAYTQRPEGMGTTGDGNYWLEPIDTSQMTQTTSTSSETITSVTTTTEVTVTQGGNGKSIVETWEVKTVKKIVTNKTVTKDADGNETESETTQEVEEEVRILISREYVPETVTETIAIQVPYIEIEEVEVDEHIPRCVDICDDNHQDLVYIFVPKEYGDFDYTDGYKFYQNDNHYGSEAMPIQIEVKAVYDNGTEVADAFGTDLPGSMYGRSFLTSEMAADYASQYTIPTRVEGDTSSEVDREEISPDIPELSSTSQMVSCTSNAPDYTDHDFDSVAHGKAGRTIISMNGHIGDSGTVLENYRIGDADSLAKAAMVELDEKGATPDTWYNLKNPEELRGLIKTKGTSTPFISLEDLRNLTDRNIGNAYKKYNVSRHTNEPVLKPNSNIGVRYSDERLHQIGDYHSNISISTYSYGIEQLLSRITTSCDEYTVGKSNIYNTEDFVTNNLDRVDSVNWNLDDFEYQLDYTTDSLDPMFKTGNVHYNVVPEVLMTYKKGYMGSDGKLLPYEKRGELGSVYTASFNYYQMDMPMYNRIDMNYKPELATISSATANSSAAKNLAKNSGVTLATGGSPSVVYTGAELNTIAKVDDEAMRTVTFTSYVLDFKDDTSKQQAAAAWNGNAYKNTTAQGAAQLWLNNFVKEDAEGNRSFRLNAALTSSFTKEAKSELLDGSQNWVQSYGTETDNAPVVTLNEVVFGSKDQTIYDNGESFFDIEIRNGKLAFIIDKATNTKYNVYDYVDEADFIARGSSIVGLNHEIFEAVVNMKLFEFASTLVTNGGTETWGKYENFPSSSKQKRYIGYDNAGTSVSEEVGKRNSEYMSNIAGNKWFAEDSTVFHVRKFETTTTLPQSIAFSWKVPLKYGYAAPKNKRDLFSKIGYCYAELGLDFGQVTLYPEKEINTEVSVIAPSGQTKGLNGKFDVAGNELTGSLNTKSPSQLQFIISDATVNDLYQ